MDSEERQAAATRAYWARRCGRLFARSVTPWVKTLSILLSAATGAEDEQKRLLAQMGLGLRRASRKAGQPREVRVVLTEVAKALGLSVQRNLQAREKFGCTPTEEDA